MQMKTKKKIHTLAAYGYILPLAVLLSCFYVLPILMSMYFSFTTYNIIKPAEFVGFENYIDLWKDKIFFDSLRNTVLFTVGVVPVQTVFALIMAVWLTSKEKSRLREFAKAVMFIPVISSMILIGIVWRILLNGEASPLNLIFHWIGKTPPNWLGDPKIALVTLMMITVWKNTGYFMVIYISGIMEIPKTYYEAARVDGANKWHEFWYITVPMLKPITTMVVLLGFIWSFQIFDLIYTVTGGGPGTATMTMVVHIYNLSFKQFNAGYAMTVANVLFFIIALGTIFQKKLLKRENNSH